jgi:hypothetical protein
MSILDDAIREHLELKRAHGADDSEVKRLEDEAFGPPQRPDEIDPFAEAPTEFLASLGESPADVPEIGDEGERSGRRPDIADLQEPPPAPDDPAGAAFFDAAAPDAPAVEDEHSPAPHAPPPSPTDAADLPLPPPPGEAPAADPAPPTDEAAAPPTDEAVAPPTDEVPAPPTDEELAPPVPPAVEEHPAGEHEAIVDTGPGTEERHAIADQPTQMFDVQAHVDAEADEAPPATGEQASPTDEELVDAAQEEPQAAPPAPEDAGPTELHEQPPLESRGPDAEVAGHPPAEVEPEEGSGEFDFFNEQRLSDELDQALEAPLPPTDEHLAMPRYEDAPASDDQGAIFDFESQPDEAQPGKAYEEDPSQEVLRRADEAEAAEEPAEGEDDNEFDPETGHDDVLEDTPRFLEDAPEDDDLWFEQKPPKDFDLD